MLNVIQLFYLVSADQGVRLASSSCATGSTNPVNIVFRYIGQIKIHHLWQLGDIQAAGCDVSGHQHTDLASLETRQRLCARSLALVAVDGRRINTSLLQFL